MRPGMKRTLAYALATSLLSLAPTACTVTDDAGDHVQLPGDQDDNPDATSGKGDAWDYSNDPVRLAHNLNYHLDELPRDGKLDHPVWADRYEVLPDDVPAWAASYWPTAEGSTNARWQGANEKSPLEKYDAAFNGAAGCDTMPSQRCGDNAKAEWDTYLGCAGPAAKWQSTQFQNSQRMYNGTDDNSNDSVDECSGHDGIAGWWGLCHAWSPSALLEPEPQHEVIYEGQTFAVSDIKALILTVYDGANATMLGGRCNATTIEHDDVGRATNSECKDVNPGALHVILTNFLGINDSALVEDRVGGAQVWNQPMVGYHITKQDEVTPAQANQCIGATGDTYTYNDKAVKLFEVKLTTDYITESYQSTEPRGMNGHISHDSYHYILEVDDRGKIIGGEYCGSSKTSHPDFLWAPTSVGSSWGRNPYVDVAKVQTLIRLSREPVQPTDPGTGDAGDSFDNTDPVAIPDNDPNGVTSDINVDQDITFSKLSVTVDITHTWRGDLEVELLRDGTAVKTLQDQAGGSADNLQQTYTVSADEAGTTSARGEWSLRVSDNAAQDTGTLNRFALTFLE